MLEATLELRKKLVRVIRQQRPEVVVCGDPTVVWAGDEYINHPDHRAAALAALEAAFPAAGQPNLFEELEEEGLKAHKVRKVYVSTWDEGNLRVNVTKTMETKIAALRAHKSQMKDWDPGPMLKEWGAETAKDKKSKKNKKETKYAEAFRVITLVNDEEWSKRTP